MATMTLDDLVTQLGSAYGDGLRCVVLYGSAAGVDHIPDRSDYNVLVLLDEAPAGRLAAASAVARAWRAAGNPPPLTMTMGEWSRSADIFPMEYADILERHRVLYGDAPFAGIVVRPADLRLQLEQQVMGKLLQLRQGALLAGTDGDRQLELLAASVSTILVLCRAVLRLHGEPANSDAPTVARRVGDVASVDATAIARAFAHARGSAPIPPGEAGAVLAGYLGALEQLDAHLDSFPS